MRPKKLIIALSVLLWAASIAAGQVKTGARAYDDLPEPYRTACVNRWKQEITGVELDLKDLKVKTASAKSKARTMHTKFVQGRNSPGFIQAPNARDVEEHYNLALGVGKMDQALRVLKKNDPPFIDGQFLFHLLIKSSKE